MYPVNIQLKLSDREQLKFLEEIISLLHVHQDREGLESNLAMGVTPPNDSCTKPVQSMCERGGDGRKMECIK